MRSAAGARSRLQGVPAMPEPRDSRLWVTHQGRNRAFFWLSKPHSSYLLSHYPFCTHRMIMPHSRPDSSWGSR